MSLRPPAAQPVSPGRAGQGRAGAVMARVAVRESVTLAGRVERARAARRFVGEVLGPEHPCGDLAVLLFSEIFGNSVRHSGSDAPGETVAVAVRAGDGVVRVDLTDRTGPGTPELRPAGRDAEGGRGASARRGPRGSVGLATARRADGGLVRATAPLLMSPPGGEAQMDPSCTSDGRGSRRRPAAAQVADAGWQARYISGPRHRYGCRPSELDRGEKRPHKWTV